MTWPTPIALFDLDGTLCNVEHRVPFINGRHDFDVPKGGNIHATWKCRKCGSYIDSVAAEKFGGKVAKAKCHQDWRSFYESMRTDPPIEPMTYLARMMLMHGEPAVGLATGRPEEYRAATEQWLREQSLPPEMFAFLKMREDGDSRADEIIKSEMLADIRRDYEVVMVFDDRQKVVDMWRSEGLLCLQVAPGDF